MCVSAEASFGLAGLLAPVGVYCLKQAKERDRSMLPFAAVPLFFSAQQFCEGLVWTGLHSGNNRLVEPAALTYMFFALMFWLCWIPFSAAFTVTNRRKRYILGIDVVLGFIGGAFFYLPILLYPHLMVVSVVRHSIAYDISQTPALQLVSPPFLRIGYLVVIALPLVLTTNNNRKGVIVFSSVLITSAAIVHAYFSYAFASVWCFVAAILSLVMAYTFHELPVATLSAREPNPTIEMPLQRAR